MATSRSLAFSLWLTCAIMAAWPALAGGPRHNKTVFSFPGSDQFLNVLQTNVTADTAGNLYGMVLLNGGDTCIGETVCVDLYRLVPPAVLGHPWSEQVLYTFQNPEASGPFGQLALDRSGNIYGVFSDGVVWEVTPPAGGTGQWSFQALHDFAPAGYYPTAGLVMDASGTLYGTASNSASHATKSFAFSLVPPAPGGTAWTEADIHDFGRPYTSPGELSISRNGTELFGLADPDHGGDGHSCQAAYRLQRHGRAWVYNEIYRLNYTGCVNAAITDYRLLVDQNGNLFGTLPETSHTQRGVAFELSPPPSGQTAWSETVLHDFSASPAEGSNPNGGLVAIEKRRALFGTARYDGPGGSTGVVFSLQPPASGTGNWTYTVLHGFKTHRDLYDTPIGSLTVGLRHMLFGAASGYPNDPDVPEYYFVFSQTPELPPPP